MIRFISVTLIFLLTTACVSTKDVNLDSSLTSGFSGKSISITERTLPAFSGLTPGNALAGVAGAIYAIERGNEIVADNNIADPASYMADILSQDFASTFNVVYSNANNGVLESEKVAKIVTKFPNTDYLMDVRTINWSFAYFPTSWGKYRVIYSAKLRLIDVKQGTVVAEGFCSRVPKKTPDAPLYDELLADEAFIIKRELNIAANQCINEFKKDVLNLPETPLETIKLVKKETPVNTVGPLASTNESAELSKPALESQYPETLEQLKSASSIEMRLAAIKVGKEKLYRDEAIFLTLINILVNEVAQEDEPIERIRIDGLSWVAISLGKAGDKRAIPVLTKVKDSILPRKVRKHAIASLKRY